MLIAAFIIGFILGATCGNYRNRRDQATDEMDEPEEETRRQTMTYPTNEEIDAAIDAITKHGSVRSGGGADTATLCLLVMRHPILREATLRKLSILKGVTKTDADTIARESLDLDPFLAGMPFNVEQFLEGMIVSFTAYGLNIGIRIGEARLAAERSRGTQ